ncbi:hypothetical protein QCI42_19925 [Bacillus fungorum]
MKIIFFAVSNFKDLVQGVFAFPSLMAMGCTSGQEAFNKALGFLNTYK